MIVNTVLQGSGASGLWTELEDYGELRDSVIQPAYNGDRSIVGLIYLFCDSDGGGDECEIYIPVSAYSIVTYRIDYSGSSTSDEGVIYSGSVDFNGAGNIAHPIGVSMGDLSIHNGTIDIFRLYNVDGSWSEEPVLYTDWSARYFVLNQ